jgi:hypothetical protein
MHSGLTPSLLNAERFPPPGCAVRLFGGQVVNSHPGAHLNAANPYDRWWNGVRCRLDDLWWCGGCYPPGDLCSSVARRRLDDRCSCAVRCHRDDLWWCGGCCRRGGRLMYGASCRQGDLCWCGVRRRLDDRWWCGVRCRLDDLCSSVVRCRLDDRWWCGVRCRLDDLCSSVVRCRLHARRYLYARAHPAPYRWLLGGSLEVRIRRTDESDRHARDPLDTPERPKALGTFGLHAHRRS